MSDRKLWVRRLVEDAINGDDLDVLDELCTPTLAVKLRRAFREFRTAFPDWRQEIRELVVEDDTVVARFRCTGTQLGEWQGMAASGRRMRVDEVYFFRFDGERLSGLWGPRGHVDADAPAGGHGRRTRGARLAELTNDAPRSAGAPSEAPTVAFHRMM